MRHVTRLTDTEFAALELLHHQVDALMTRLDTHRRDADAAETARQLAHVLGIAAEGWKAVASRLDATEGRSDV